MMNEDQQFMNLVNNSKEMSEEEIEMYLLALANN